MIAVEDSGKSSTATLHYRPQTPTRWLKNKSQGEICLRGQDSGFTASTPGVSMRPVSKNDPFEAGGVIAGPSASRPIAAAYIGNIERPVSSCLLTLVKISSRITAFYGAGGWHATRTGQ
jgi:hypothetical protein